MQLANWRCPSCQYAVRQRLFFGYPYLRSSWPCPNCGTELRFRDVSGGLVGVTCGILAIVVEWVGVVEWPTGVVLIPILVGGLVLRFQLATVERAESAEPEHEPPEDDVSEPAACLDCGGTVPAGTDKCSSCGWSYRVGVQA